MPLHDLIRLCEADAAPAFFGREVKLEDLVLHIFRDPGSLIFDFDQSIAVLLAHRDRERTPRWASPVRRLALH